MQTIQLDLSKKEITPILYAKQADVGRKFKAILTDGGVAYPVPAGAAVSIWYSGSSGEGNYTDIGAESAVSVSGNEIVVEMIAQMLANYGVGTVCIVVHTADGKQLGTWNIPYMVEPLPGMGSESAKAYFTAFSKAVGDLPYPDASLSAPGKAADAAATGAALAGKAPAGYGLGGHAKTIYDWNTAMLNGWYRDAGNASNSPFAGMFTFGFTSNYAEDCVQNVYARGGFAEDCKILHAIRMYDADNKAWGAWEYVNPRIMPDQEYRTTERHNGVAVYAKHIEYTPTSILGTATSISDANIPHEISNFDSLVRCIAKNGPFVFPLMNSNGGTAFINTVNATSIVIRMNNRTITTDTTLSFDLYYTKTG